MSLTYVRFGEGQQGRQNKTSGLGVYGGGTPASSQNLQKGLWPRGPRQGLVGHGKESEFAFY